MAIRDADFTLLAGRVFDGVEFDDGPLTIEVRGETITSVEGAAGELPPGGPYLDARDSLVMPGLINAHVHIARGGMFGVNDPISVRQVVRNFRTALEAGVTTVGEMGCSAGMAYALREHTRLHPEAGPQVVACGPILTVRGGYPLDWMPKLYAKMGVALACESQAEARQNVRRVVAAGMDHVKLASMHRSYADRPIPTMGLPVARAVVDEAHAHGRMVFAHAHIIEDYQLALDAGVDALMHSSFDPLEPEMVERVAASGVFLCPTLSVFEGVERGVEGRWDRDTRYTRFVSRKIQKEWSAFCDAYEKSGDVLPPGIAGGLPKVRLREAIDVPAENLRLLRRAGVRAAFGVDCNYGFSVLGRPVDELSAMQRAGMSPLECLRAATSTAAELLGCQDRGRLEPGMRADIIVVDRDTERDVGAIEIVRDVVAGGRPIQGDTLERLGTDAGMGSAVLRGIALTARQALR
jgi:imidazolonepropionase-like amidohydrolase